MTDKEIYEYMLIELNKVEAPSLLLEDYNYFINKAINNYVNKRYNLYDTSQQTTDDLQVLTGTVEVTIDYSTLDGDKPASTVATGVEFPAVMLGTIPGEVTPANPIKSISELAYPGEEVVSNYVSTFQAYSAVEDYAQFLINVDPQDWTDDVGIDQDTLLDAEAAGEEYVVEFKKIGGLLPSIGESPTAKGNTNSPYLKYQDTYRVIGVEVAQEGVYVTLDTPYQAQTVEFLKTGDTTRTTIFFRMVKRKKPTKTTGIKQAVRVAKTTYGYLFPLPNNYYHLLNCIVNYEMLEDFKCYPVSTIQPFGAKRLTADMYAFIINNAYLKPEYKRPYYYLRDRIANTAPDLEVRCGNLGRSFRLHSVIVDYLRTPTKVRLTTEVVADPNNSGTPMEFPDYVCQEIIKELTALVMENSSDPRLNTNIPINQSILTGGQPQ